MSLSQDAPIADKREAGAGVAPAQRNGSGIKLPRPRNLWDDDIARNLGEADCLLYRPNLLGSDLSVTNFGGGNTSAKLEDIDPLTGAPMAVLWVKGSGGDLG